MIRRAGLTLIELVLATALVAAAAAALLPLLTPPASEQGGPELTSECIVLKRAAIDYLQAQLVVGEGSGDGETIQSFPHEVLGTVSVAEIEQREGVTLIVFSAPGVACEFVVPAAEHGEALVESLNTLEDEP